MTTWLDPLGSATCFGFDTDGQVTGITYPDGSNESFLWANGLMTSWTDPFVYSEIYGYDGLGNLIQLTDRQGEVTNFTYDDRGNRTSQTDANGHVTTYTYDLLGRVLESTDSLGNMRTFTHDAMGNVVSQTDELGRTTTFNWDLVGQLIGTTNPDGSMITTGYDALNRLVSLVEDPDGLNQETITLFDGAGNTLLIIDPDENTTSYTYDSRDQCVAETDPLGNSRQYVYDAAGNCVETTDRNGRVRQYTYDEYGRLIAEAWLDSDMQVIRTITWTFDANGNLVETGDPAATLTFTYDEVNNLTSRGTGLEAEVQTGTDETHEGTLGPGDMILNTEYYADVFTFDAQLGDDISLSLVSLDFDTALWCVSPDGPVYYDDNGGDGTNSLLEITADATGLPGILYWNSRPGKGMH